MALEAHGAELLREVGEESDPAFRIRRAGEWEASSHSPGWLDLFASIVQARDVLVRELIAGRPGAHGAPRDNETRAMIHALNTVLKMPDAVRKDAEQALNAIERFESLRPR